MKKTIFELVSSIQQDLNNNNSSKGNNIEIPEDISQKYINFKKWLDENGTIYPKLNFPVKFNNIFGCEATEDIKENSCIFYIPYKLLIDSSNIKYDFLPQSLKDNNTIKFQVSFFSKSSVIYKNKLYSFHNNSRDITFMNLVNSTKQIIFVYNEDIIEEYMEKINLSFFISMIRIILKMILLAF